jgi:flagellin-like hook-associated protein FlgL
VTGHPNAEALLAELNREFVLLDGQTFQSFMDETALNRGRSFSGLLGLARYSALRQQLQQLCQTRSFNSHFDTSAQAAKKAGADRAINTARTAIAADYEVLVQEKIAPLATSVEAQARCQAALNAIPTLSSHCDRRTFMQISGDDCHAAVNAAEGGADKGRLAALIQTETRWKTANKEAPTVDDVQTLQALAHAREQTLAATSGELLQRLYKVSDEVMSADDWSSPNLCPTCDRQHEISVLDHVREKLGQYDAVEKATAALATEWAAKGWSELEDLEKLTIGEQEVLLLARLKRSGEEGTITSVEASALGAHLATIRTKALIEIQRLADESAALSRTMPPSLVTVTRAIEAAQRLQKNWSALETAEREATDLGARAQRMTRLKTFLDKAGATFAQAESSMTAARLARVEPLCQTIFDQIMFSPVTPVLRKPTGTEDITIGLANFWTLRNVSAQALLSESYRNAFAVSVYLAAASLYGGSPRFMVLDDVTSSFDAGHQHHLVEVIRTQFARPLQASGPQVILLSHDTLLEKLFNRHSGSPDWSHQRLEGTAHTAVLLQSGAVNKVRDATNTLLNQGRVDDAAPRLRQYLEYVLQMIIDKCRIPVPPDLAFGDDKRTPGEYLNAIKAAVELEDRAGSLILEPAQKQALQMNSATIIGNFVSHWATGQTQAFSAPALLGVMQAIERYQDCFKYEPTPGAQLRFYATLHRR